MSCYYENIEGAMFGRGFSPFANCALAVLLAMTLSNCAEAEERTERTDISNSGYGVLNIRVTNPQEDQASSYVRTSYIEPLWERLRSENGPLREVLRQISLDNAGEMSKEEALSNSCIESPRDSNTLTFKYGRIGWFGASAELHSFLTCTQPGTGGFTEPVLEAVFNLGVVAEGDDQTAAPFLVTVSLRGYRRMYDEGKPFTRFGEPMIFPAAQ